MKIKLRVAREGARFAFRAWDDRTGRILARAGDFCTEAEARAAGRAAAREARAAAEAAEAEALTAGTPTPLTDVEVGDTIHFDPFMDSPAHSVRVARIEVVRRFIDRENRESVTRVLHFDGGGTLPFADPEDALDGDAVQVERVTRSA